MTKELQERVKAGEVGMPDVVRRLAELAFGRVNDCVKLALEDKPNVGRLDLTLLSEVRRSEKGAVEVRLVDRLQALKQLSQAVGTEEGQVEAFLEALGK